MIRKIKRLLFAIPMIPFLIIYWIFLPILWVSERVINWCENIQYRYGFNLRKRFPDLVVKVQSSNRTPNATFK